MCLHFCLTEFVSYSLTHGVRIYADVYPVALRHLLFYYSQQELPSDTFFVRALQLAVSIFFIVLLYRMSLSCGISTRPLEAASSSMYCVLF